MRRRILVDRSLLGYRTWERVIRFYKDFDLVDAGPYDYRLPDPLWLVPIECLSKLTDHSRPDPSSIPGLNILQPDVTPINILVYAHQRSNYFELTLNSLRWNLSAQPNVFVYILLSNASKSVEDLALRFVKKRPNTTVWATDNVAYGAINLLIQLTQTRRFMILEEDYILPHHTEELLPKWAYRFAEILDQGYDLTGFSTSIENLPRNFTRPYIQPDRAFPNSGHQWLLNWPLPQITGNGLCMRTDFYLNATPRNPPFYATGDGDLVKLAKSTAFSSIRGYHIGFNQEMDGNPNLSSMHRFPNPCDTHNIKNLLDGSVTTLNISGKKVK